MSARSLIDGWLGERLDADAAAWVAGARAEMEAGCGADRFCALLSTASRHAPRGSLAPDADERAAAAALLDGWDPERWTTLEAVRVALVLARPDLADGFEAVLEEAFRFPEVGESCALYKCLPLLPDPGRFAWRAGEGARSNMRVVFESVCCDSPYAARFFDDVAWRQAVIKCLFVEAPLWRVHGLDERLDPELARMALDLADERRSAHRPVRPELWLCLGTHGGERGLASLERELEGGDSGGRAAAAIALVRAGERDRVQSLVATETDALVRDTMVSALGGRTDQRAFQAFDPSVQGAS